MPEDARLTDFADAGTRSRDDSEAEDAPEAADDPESGPDEGEEPPDAGRPTDEPAELQSESAEPRPESTEPTRDSPEEPPVTTDWAPGGATCESCGERAERRWRDEDAWVCGGCKEW